MPTRLLSIDPGLAGTGYVFWMKRVPWAAGVLRPLQRDVTLNSDELVDRSRSIVRQLLALGPQCPTHHSTACACWNGHDSAVVIEFPEFHESLKGRTARSTGSMDKLAFLIGVMAASFPRPWAVKLVRVRQWKGQLPKEVVISRMKKRHGDRPEEIGVKSHAWDALGIGDWYLREGQNS